MLARSSLALTLLISSWALASTNASQPPAAAKVQKAPKVIMIGLDGVSLNLLEPYIQQGVTPNMGKLIAEGGAADLASFWPLRTPQVWTSAVTGKLPGQHGLWDHVSNSYYNPPPFRTKARHPLTTADRKSKALWQILSDANFKTLSVGWISSWPAEKLTNATIVAPANLSDKRQSSIKGSFWRDAPHQVQPEQLWPKVKKLIVEPQDISADELARFADVPPKGSPLFKLPYLERYVYTLSWSLARAKTVENATLALLPEVQPDLLLSYFQCSDSLLHRFWIFQEGEAAVRERLTHHKISSEHSAELARRFGKVVEACYRDLDERVGRILEAARGPDTLVLIVSDHGFGPAPKPHPARDEPYGGNHLDDGIIIAAGPGIPPGRKLDGASVVDLTPTLLHYFGLPVGQDMRGRVLPQLFADGALEKNPPKLIPTYEAKPQLEVPYPEGWPERKKRAIAVDE